MKEEPTLLDQWLVSPNHHAGPPLSTYLAAKRFVFDDKASTFMGNLLRRATMEVLQEHEFARSPYDVTWVEMDHRALYSALMVPYTQDETADYKLGFLYDHNAVYQIVSGPAQKHPSILPYMVHLHTPMSFEDELIVAHFCGMSRMTFRACMLGTANIEPEYHQQWWKEQAREICCSHRIQMLFGRAVARELTTDQWRQLIQSGAGFLKLILTSALLLTRPGSKIITATDTPHRRGIWKGKNFVYRQHHKVTIRLAHRDPVIRFIGQLGTGAHRRRHGVRGHWAHHRKYGCDHMWNIIDKDHYECVLCPAKRWWIKAHNRGDADKGVVTKDYEVTR